MTKNKSLSLEKALQVILATDGDNPLRQMLEWMVQQALELVMGINTLGRREILSVRIADTENAVTWSDTFRDLKRRGLSGVLLVTSDHHQGIKAAASRHFQGASWQRCQFHFMQNILPLCPKRERKALHTALRAAFDSEDLDGANRLVNEISIRWAETKPALADRIEDGMVDALACFSFPVSHRKKIRTSNMLEWLNGQLRKRTRVVRIFLRRGLMHEAHDGARHGAERGMGDFTQEIHGHRQAGGLGDREQHARALARRSRGVALR